MGNAAVVAIAQKYLEEARHATRPLVFRDALVAENEIIVKADAFADDLSGFQGYRFEIGKRGKLGRPVEITLGNPPTCFEFMTWAKAQPTKVLRTLLRANGIQATGTVHLPMVYLLTLLYEDRQAKAVGMPLLRSERKAEIRAKRVQALTLAVTLTGVRDEEVLVQMGFWVERGDIERQFTRYVERLKERGAMAEQKNSDLMKQLKDQADASEEKGRRREVDDEGEQESDEKPKRRSASKDSEQAAIVAGKGEKKEKAEQPKASETKSGKGKGGSMKEPTKGSKDEGEEASVKGKAKGGAAKEKKPEKPKAEKSSAKKAEKTKKPEKAGKKERTPKNTSGLTQSDFKPGDKVKYLGSRNEELKGKTLEILGKRGPGGLWVKTGDGTRGSAMAHQLEKIKK